MNIKFSIFLVILMACVISFSISATKLPAQILDRSALSIPTATKLQTLLATPKFTAQLRIQSGGADMKVDTYTSVPCVADWNEDGKKDLLVGCFYDGNVYFFNNSGTDATPVFKTGTKLKADGQDISVVYG